MAMSSPESFHMSSADLIKKEPLDYGGFGEVYLCYHKTLGQVVLKTVYTGPLRNANNRKSLLEEGDMMTKLNHERVVKLLGVIMEDGDYSLVMELIPKGNLLVMLEQVTVPISIKGRIILEILEGMVYLTENQVIHKDLKPENILVDKDFHIKIADLGLATCQTWSKLTKEESRRKSRVGGSSGARGDGTLRYMAPEHLKSIHTRSTEKSDVYSFAIVVWVVLTGIQPYEEARSEDHICECVRNGDRPADEKIPEDTHVEIIELMKRCWHQEPQQRPTFQEGYDFFLPVYREKMEPHVEEDAIELRKLYLGPEDLVEKIQSLSMSPQSLSADSPSSLLSSDRSLSAPGPVEASIEDMHFLPVDSYFETDAKGFSNPSPVEQKLERELQYHKHGSYAQMEHPENSFHHHVHPQPQRLSSQDMTSRYPVQDRPVPGSSVQSWTKTEAVQPASQDATYMPTSYSAPSLRTPQQSFDRQWSWPVHPVPDTTAPEPMARQHLNPCKGAAHQEQGGVFIHQASGIQIGNNNTLSLRGHESFRSLSSIPNGSANTWLKEALQKYEDHAITEEHLELLRDNIGANWKRCSRRLGLTEVEVETIEHDYHRDGLPEMVHQMLERWRMKEGVIGCTVGKLCRALDRQIKVDVLHQIMEICATNAST